ncbi:TWiK family of potassium channels protein 9 [Toxocara canis]|uniref:TWiK family of potassium channels protein 9 n=1 Tax=Toxocara canis TaxID=6265 RepID=A0A0B2V8V6_TOXCA|nr:TWiK family of potassium channels protein 9 [Toxocara canis]
MDFSKIRSKMERLNAAIGKATPFIVHLMMVVSVSLYAILGAVIIRELESKEIDDSSMIVKRTTGDTSMQVRVINDTIESMEKMKIILPNAGKLRHARRRHVPKGSEGELLVGHIIHSSTTIVRSQRCVLDILKNLLKKGDCSADVLSRAVASTVDRCYGVLIERAHQSPRKRSQRSTMTGDFSYGNVAPQTFAGRLFCIFYGLIGIPLTLLAIADLGKFLSELMETAQKILTNFTRKCWKKHYLRRNILKAQKYGLQSSRNGRLKAEPLVEEFADLESAKDPKSSNEDDEKDPSDSEADTAPRQAISLLLLFLAYILIGALMITTYEPDMDYFKAIYFNFVTLTSIGLGDIVPRSETYMLFTITYIAIGLALTTIAIEIAADTLKKLHYFGRKIENVANVHIWFGGKKFVWFNFRLIMPFILEPTEKQMWRLFETIGPHQSAQLRSESL